ncbi:S-layer glycoprotein N-glycosyltransferase AglJ [Halolamina salifodinae]|uniref:Dolichol-phosphate mannosyltransferase n=1 Tax=Halolamina salifodinae TaxID=1202767 RepID=A0A8T4GWD8_9EURY|nr:S-layer glycoprotein N-glycosyltransferase AglJ [Halolamina salifodinae]MBP1985618.1 dolichol-phosphate mannosyltransferase [Halolamina salifodinae]
MPDREHVTVLLPTYDEAATIGDCVDGFQAEGFDDVLVMDGDSDDDTREIAREHGARVEVQSGTGKGQAIREAVSDHIDREYVLMADGDGTYKAEDADQMLPPLAEGSEHVIGDRFADMEAGAMTKLNQVGNKLTNRLFATIHGESFADILSGYRAFTRASFERMQLSADGFGIETEMAVECAKRDIPTTVVPITYRKRPAGSSTNLHPIRDGSIIFLELFRRAKTSNPLFYFGSVGVVSGVAGLLLAAYVGFEWFVYGIPHNVLALAGAAGIILGVQLVMFGVLSDLILTLHREQLDRIKSLDED